MHKRIIIKACTGQVNFCMSPLNGSSPPGPNEYLWIDYARVPFLVKLIIKNPFNATVSLCLSLCKPPPIPSPFIVEFNYNYTKWGGCNWLLTNDTCRREWHWENLLFILISPGSKYLLRKCGNLFTSWTPRGKNEKNGKIIASSTCSNGWN